MKCDYLYCDERQTHGTFCKPHALDYAAIAPRLRVKRWALEELRALEQKWFSAVGEDRYSEAASFLDWLESVRRADSDAPLGGVSE